MLYKDQIDKNRIPAHIAIIMDGNGRWAKQQGHARTFGHQAGAETVHVIAEEAARLGVKYLTLYTFSTENWNRPVDEVAALMSLLMDSIEEETPAALCGAGRRGGAGTQQSVIRGRAHRHGAGV